jgi:hypothetical protein
MAPACSLEIISQISQPASSVFLSQKTSQQYFQPAKSAQANRLKVFYLKSFRFLFLKNYRILRFKLSNISNISDGDMSYIKIVVIDEV